MFGKRSDVGIQQTPVPPVPQTNAPGGDAFAGGAPVPNIPDLGIPAAGTQFSRQAARPGSKSVAPAVSKQQKSDPALGPRKSENYYDIKSTIFNALIDAIDLTQLGQLDR